MNESEKPSASADLERGKRLEKFLKEKFPNDSWRARSKAIGINDNTVIGWRKGREISGEGLVRLHEIGCDLYWLLTGATEAPDFLPYVDQDYVSNLEERNNFLERQNMRLRSQRDEHISEIAVLKYRLGEPYKHGDDFSLHDLAVEGTPGISKPEPKGSEKTE